MAAGRIKRLQYLKLAAICDTTHDRRSQASQMYLGIVDAGEQGSYLVIRDGTGKRRAKAKIGDMRDLDTPSRIVARQLTLDGSLPVGMDELG